MTNFDFLKNEKKFSAFADVAIAAEKIFHIDAEACAINCRRAAEFAVKWMYSVDAELQKPAYDDTFAVLTSTEEFRKIVGNDIIKQLEFIRKVGNKAAHTGKKIDPEKVRLCVKNLFVFLDLVAYFYADEYENKKFNPELLNLQAEKPDNFVTEVDFAKLVAENERLKELLTARREVQKKSYTPHYDPTEYVTRKLYIDVMLQDLGWIENENWRNEYRIEGMPNSTGVGFADYVLFGDDGKPLAVIEAKKTCVDVSAGRQQAKLYADLLEQKFGRRPVIFLTNGFETRIWEDKYYPERAVAAIYSKRDLEKLFNLRAMRKSLKSVNINKNIAGRYYQEGAIKAVCAAFGERNRRKALLVMATGSGKTRTVIGLCEVLIKYGWVKNILFLADRNALVTQAKRSFVNILPDLSVTNLCEEKDNYSAHCVFSTYQTMMNCIDEAKDEEGKLFTCGHFDLVICDEAHRSIYNKYRDIFNYFDAPLVGLTATPKNEIDKNTYDIFELEKDMPTYGYELAQAVNDGYLVDFLSIETKLKFIEQGIVYDELSEEEKEIFEKTFADENGETPESISSSALNEWIFNEDTIRQALRILMSDGIKIDYGAKIGKTIIFAKNHRHAEKILEVFGKEYPHLVGYAQVIDNKINYAQSAIDEFSRPNKLPQIAISVDMLDTGIDIPEILNLVFFKKVLSKAKFWQMIGRGTRLCPNLLNGKDKNKFYIFDFCGNFEFFRMNKGRATANALALQGAIFNLKAQIIYKLQDMAFQTAGLIEFRKSLVEELSGKVNALNRDNFAVKQHLRYVEKFSAAENYAALSYEDTLIMAEELAPLILPDGDETNAVRFDALMYGIELAYIVGKAYSRANKDLIKKVTAVSHVANIPEIMAQSELINEILHGDYLKNAGINEFENIRNCIRDLIKYIPHTEIIYNTDFTDNILSSEWREAEFDSDELKNYRAKAEFYIRKHQDNAAIAKLKTNKSLTAADVKELEKILWSEVGTKPEYEAEFGQKPLGEFVREIVGLEMVAAKEAFAHYLNDANLNDRQIYFLNQIVEYVVHNGIMKDFSVLRESPFTDRGSIVEVFSDLSVWSGIKEIIDQINANALAA